VYEGNFYQKLKLKSQTIEVLHQFCFEKRPHQPYWKEGKVQKRNN
jgi:hypothetical protein